MSRTGTTAQDDTVDNSWVASFRTFWVSQGIAQFAAQGVYISIPLIAVAQLGAGAAETGFIAFAQYLPVLIITPILGTVVDSVRKRPIMMLGHMGRAITFGLLALAAGSELLSIPMLIVAAFLAGAVSASFDVALQAYVPRVVPLHKLVPSNAKIQGTLSFAQVLGPAIGGLVAGLGNPAAGFAIYALAYLSSAILLGFAREGEGALEAVAESFWRRTVKGFELCFKSEPLRALLIAGSWFNLFEQALITIFLVYGVKVLGLAPFEVGLVIALGAIGAVVGSVVSAKLTGKVGRRAILISSMGLASVTPLGLALTPAGSAWTQFAVVLVFFAYGLGVTSYNIQAMSYRQQLAPHDMQGRVSAVYRFFAYGSLALGGLAAGVLSAILGLAVALGTVALALLVGWAGFVLLSKSAIRD